MPIASKKLYMPVPLCPICNPEEITKLNQFDEDVYQCPKCGRLFLEDQCIWTNYLWLYKDEIREYERLK